MPPVGFEARVSAGEQPQICALSRAATGTGERFITQHIYVDFRKKSINRLALII